MFNLFDSVRPIRLTEEQKNKAAKWIYDKNFKKMAIVVKLYFGD